MEQNNSTTNWWLMLGIILLVSCAAFTYIYDSGSMGIILGMMFTLFIVALFLIYLIIRFIWRYTAYWLRRR